MQCVHYYSKYLIDVAVTHTSLEGRVVNLRSIWLSIRDKAGNKRHVSHLDGVDRGQGVKSKSSRKSRGPQCNTQYKGEPHMAEERKKISNQAAF